MKLIFRIQNATRKISLYDDKGQFRIHLHGRGRDQWFFPHAGISNALRAVDKEQMEQPRARWQIVVDLTDEYATRAA